MDRQGLEAYAKQLSEKLPGGMEGTVKLDGADEAVCTTRVSESAAFIPLLLCRDAAFKDQVVIDARKGNFDRAFVNREFESEKVNRKFAIQVSPNQDENKLLQLFDPVFLDWLGENAPEDFHFILEKGKLEATLAHEPKDTDELDELAKLTVHVADRLRDEALEEAPVAEVKGALPAPEYSAHDREIIDKVDWDEPPKDMATAMAHYKHIAGRQMISWRAPLILGGGLFLLILLILFGFNAAFNVVGGGPDDFGNTGKIVDDVVKGIYLLVAVGVGGLVLLAAHSSVRDRHALEYGAAAFMEQYGAKRGLKPEDPAEFEQHFMRVKLPGSPTRVLYGKLDGIKDPGRIIVGEDDAGGGFMAVVVGDKVLAKGSVDGDTTGPTATGLDELVKKAA